MNKNLIVNKRIAFRNKFHNEGKMFFSDHTKNIHIEESIFINNISIRGIQVVFSNNDLLFLILDYKNQDNTQIQIKSRFFDEEYTFCCSISWIKMFDIGEKDFYVLTGLLFIEENFKEIKEKVIGLIASFNMENSLKKITKILKKQM